MQSSVKNSKNLDYQKTKPRVITYSTFSHWDNLNAFDGIHSPSSGIDPQTQINSPGNIDLTSTAKKSLLRCPVAMRVEKPSTLNKRFL